MSGHIRRRGANSWELKYDANRDPITGKRRVRFVSFKGTKRKAEVELRGLSRKMQRAKASTRRSKQLPNSANDG